MSGAMWAIYNYLNAGDHLTHKFSLQKNGEGIWRAEISYQDKNGSTILGVTSETPIGAVESLFTIRDNE